MNGWTNEMKMMIMKMKMKMMKMMIMKMKKMMMMMMIMKLIIKKQERTNRKSRAMPQ
jgi:hypothetical protein